MRVDDWPCLVERPGRGQVRACPFCGNVAIFTCYHDGETFQTVVMNANRAATLRRNSGEYEPQEYVCGGCGYEGPLEIGSTLGDEWFCAKCSGKSARQVERARRQVRTA